MKNVATLTFQNTTNYGALLQAFALQKKIDMLGAKCVILNYHCDAIEQRECFALPHYNNSIYQYATRWKDYLRLRTKRKVIKEFQEKYMCFSKESYDLSNIAEANKKYDAFIVGSDMVWELGITGNDFTYFLDFADPNKRYSYAASFGVDKIDNKLLDRCAKELSKFSYISVRELGAKDIINQILSNEVKVHVDPTLIHKGAFWKEYEEKPNLILPDKYILMYFLDDKGVMIKKTLEIARKHDAKIVIISDKAYNAEGCITLSNASVGEFLYCIDHAELVVTGSYHGMIYSLNYNTNFMYYNRANSTRMESIAKLTGTENRRMTNDNNPEIFMDYSSINTCIDSLRDEAERYLKTIIS